MDQQLSNDAVDAFAKKLVDAGFLDAKKAAEIIQQSSAEKIPLINFIERKKLLDCRAVADMAAEHYGMALYDLFAHDRMDIPEGFVDHTFVENYFALPIKVEENHLVVAIADPAMPGKEDFAKQTGYSIEFVLVEADKLRATIDNLKKDIQIKKEDHNSVKQPQEEEQHPHMFSALDEVAKNQQPTYIVDHSVEKTDLGEAMDETTVSFVDKVLKEAIVTKVSDIHFEAYEGFYRVRYRKDGILVEVATPSSNKAAAIVARLKVMANLDVFEHRVPQDGRFRYNEVEDHPVDFRMSTCPTLHGEKVVMRILDPMSTALDVKTLGMEEDQQAMYLKAVNSSQGMILVTGPTGSGKTVSLYSALGLLNKPEVNISTVEDPVEIYMQGVNQVQVNTKTGMTFSGALRSFLRQDPDVIMVGEIRDLETAEIAVKAAQTGHLVLSTLHTNSAPETLTRLSNIGIKPYNIASSVLLVMAQRLVRRLCEHCKKPMELPKEALLKEGFTEDAVDFKVYEPGSCDKCSQGYSGRIGIYEVMPISEEMGRLIMSDGNAIELADQAKKEGLLSLREAGLRKVREGITSLEELNRVTSG